jgi:hypothetical protein
LINLFKRVQKARITQFTSINILVSPLGMATYYFFSEVMGFPVAGAFCLMSGVTTVASYPVHRRRIFVEDRLHWRVNMRRWGAVRLAAFAAGMGIVGGLTSFTLPFLSPEVQSLCAVILNGALLAKPVYELSERWAFAERVEVQGAKA